jgi:phosphoribosylaminoimidazole-succinocarboxamide synthase
MIPTASSLATGADFQNVFNHSKRGLTTMTEPIRETDFTELKILKRGKVRDVYDLGEHLLLVATDRISAFDVVMPNPVPDKGIILTQISLFWFDVMQPIIENHVVSSDVKQYPEICHPYASALQGRSMLVKKAQPLPVECIVRGYISGSGWKEYTESGSVCGIELPTGLKESQQLPEPIFTPSTKAEMGEHDINIDFNETVRLIGKTTAEKIRDLSMAIYKNGAALAGEKGIIIADTKFEFGLTGDDLILIDEILTPDSSRFWPKETYRPGGPQKSYDKQYLRDYLNTLDWDKKAPGPPLPEDVIANTRQKYLDALTQLSGSNHGL